jgi:spore coat protein JB
LNETETAGTQVPETCPAGVGTLPRCAPYAVPLVADQGANPDRYPRKKALENGTLFPDLNLPFYLKVDAGEVADTPLNQLRALGFVVLELGLYLDTHPEDSEAFALFQQYAALEQTARADYAKNYGPLTQLDAAQADHYTWVEGPWPWHYEEG